MNLLVAWKKVLLFGAFGAVGCLAGWLVGEPFLLVAGEVAARAGAQEAPSLISRSTDPPPPPSDFLDRLKAAGAKSGDVQISLIWYDTNDLDLHCVDPDGFEIFWKPGHRRSNSGGELDVDRNAGCRDPVVEPVENIYWAEGTAPMGTYSVYLDFYQQCPRGPSESDYKISVLHGGERREFKGAIRKDRADDGPKRLIYKFQLEPKVEALAPDTFRLAPGATLRVPVAVRREFFTGKVEVKAERLPASVTAEPIVLEPNQSKGELVFQATDAATPGETRIKIVAVGDGVSHSADPALVVPKSSFSLWTVISTGVWTALLALGLCLALLAGQNRYLGKPPFASDRVPLVLVVLGATAAGFVSGSVGQVLYFVFLAIGVAKLGFLIGWVLLGSLLGRGVSAFIPNLDGNKAALAGVGGGLLGAVAFWVLPSEWVGRFGGAALLGFCIGLMVAVVEVAFRRAWLEVRFGERESITVNLGPEPVKVGGDARACTVWARGAAAIALRYWIRDGKVYCEDVSAHREASVTNGDTRTAGGVTVVVRTGDPPAPEVDRLPPISAPQSPPVPAPPPVAPAPQVIAPPAPVPAKRAEPDYDDGLPMPIGPPPPVRPATPSILDLDESPVVSARPVPPPAVPAPPPKPTATPSARPAPPVPKPPVPTAAKPAAPPAPKPPGPDPVAAPKSGAPDACPTCGRKAPGRPGERYCMVCDRAF